VHLYMLVHCPDAGSLFVYLGCDITQLYVLPQNGLFLCKFAAVCTVTEGFPFLFQIVH
jgi:hypothetical protein